MKKYIGVKIIEAKPMTQGKAFPNELMTTEESIADGYKVVYPDGYESWCPKEQFEDANRACNGVPFGHALEAVKQGKKIARKGWNGRGMFIVYQKGYPDGIPCNKQTAEAWGLSEGDMFIVQPYLQIQNVNKSHSMWVPSINDCLADDWYVVE